MSIVHEKPAGVSTYDWETGTTTYDVTQLTAAQIERIALAQAAAKARAALPDNPRVAKALALLDGGKVERLSATEAYVTSADGHAVYHVVGSKCECEDATRGNTCKHRLALRLATLAITIAKTLHESEGPVTLGLEALELPEPLTVAGAEVTTAVRQLSADWLQQPDAPEPAPLEAFSNCSPGHAPSTKPLEPPKPTRTVPAPFVTRIKGRSAVLYVGLLHMATQDGLVSMIEEPIHIEAELVIAKATATFKDGRVFTGMGDATPQNVTPAIAPHFRRMAGTRAKARALRDALTIGMVSFEEMLADE